MDVQFIFGSDRNSQAGSICLFITMRLSLSPTQNLLLLKCHLFINDVAAVVFHGGDTPEHEGELDECKGGREVELVQE